MSEAFLEVVLTLSLQEAEDLAQTLTKFNDRHPTHSTWVALTNVLDSGTRFLTRVEH